MKSEVILFTIVSTVNYCEGMIYYQETKFTVYNKNRQLNHSLTLNSGSEGVLNDIWSVDKTRSGDLEEGSFCRRSFDGRSGYCMPAFNCLHVVKEYRIHRTKIDFCSYRGNIPVVCCPFEKKLIHYQRISEKKCHEYHNALDGVDLSEEKKLSGKSCISSWPLIVGGTTTKIDEYPHMAAIGWTQSGENITEWKCGGSLINAQFILTAAHCTSFARKEPDIVRLGSESLNVSNVNARDYEILSVIPHPEYSFKFYYHDIALLKLKTIVTFTDFIRPACLWQLPNTEMITSVTATGWGQLRFHGPKSNQLRKVELDLIDRDVCRKLHPSGRKLSRGIAEDHQFCAGKLKGGKDTCRGDSGGPLNLMLPEYKCIKFLIGVTSFGRYCAAPNSPAVYTSIFAHLDWIEETAFTD